MLESILIEVYVTMLRQHDDGGIVDLRELTEGACKLAGLDASSFEVVQEHVKTAYGDDCQKLNAEIECMYGMHN